MLYFIKRERGEDIVLIGKRLIILVFVIFATIVVGGCGNDAREEKVILESGVIDEGYQGVVNPQVSKDLKLDDEGVEKITIKCGAKIDAPQVGEAGEKPAQSGGQEQTGGGDVARPKI